MQISGIMNEIPQIPQIQKNSEVMLWQFTISASDNLDNIDTFLLSHKLLKLTEREIDNLNGPIYDKEIVMLLSLSTKKTTTPEVFTETFKKEITPIQHKIFQKTEEKNTFWLILWSQHYCDTNRGMKWTEKATTDQYPS